MLPSGNLLLSGLHLHIHIPVFCKFVFIEYFRNILCEVKK
jgi:hypothetical protein